MQSSTTLPVTPRRHWLRWLVGSALAVVLVAVGVFLYMNRSARSALEVATAELDATDPGWRLEQIEANRRVLPDEANSAVAVDRVRRALAKANFNNSIATSEGLFEAQPPQARLNDKQRKALQAALEPLAALRGEAVRLKDLPEGHYPIHYADDFFSTNFNAQQESRGVMALLRWDALLRADQGDMAGALASCQALLNVARAIGDEPLLISAFIRFAGDSQSVATLEHVLGQGEAPAAALKPMQDAIQRELREPLLTTAVRGERGGADHAYRNETAGSSALLFLPYFRSREHAAYLRFMTKMVALSRLPAEKQTQALSEMEAYRRDLPVKLQLLLPTVGKVVDAHARCQANLRCALVALAAERYRLEQQQWPQGPEDLVKAGLLTEAPADPYDGKPLRWRREKDMLIVYSVGADNIDNGGAVDRKDPRAKNTDICFRLWDVGARGSK
jgi:hypothetical protein